MNHLKIGILLSIIISLSLTGCAGNPATPTQAKDDLLTKILARGTLVVATDPAYPPQSELVEGAQRAAGTKCATNEYTAAEFTGYDVDAAVEIAKRLGVEACFVTPSWSEVISGGWGGRWDLSAGSMAITPERTQVLYFTQPYAAGFNVMYVHKDNTTYQQAADLSGKRVGTCAGCVNEDYLKGTLALPGTEVTFVVKNPQIIGYDADLPALEDLAKGDGVILDGVVTDQETGMQAIRDGLPIRQLDEPVFFSYAAMATDQKSHFDSLSLAAKVTELIQEMLADGTLANLSKKYYQGMDYASAADKFDIHSLGQIP